MDFITHVICGANYDENDITQAAELYDVPSVTEAWVLASIRLGRLVSTKAYFPLKSALFSNLTFAATQLDNRDLKKIYAIITFHGGNVRNLFDKQTTHLISGNTKGSIYAKAITVNGVVVVTPDWVTECLKAKILIASEPYHPRLVITPRLFKQAQRPATPAQKAESEKPLSNIIGFDFEENIAKTEVPTSSNSKKEEEIPVTQGQSVTQEPQKVSTTPVQAVPVQQPTQPHHPQQQSPQQQAQSNFQNQQLPSGPRLIRPPASQQAQLQQHLHQQQNLQQHIVQQQTQNLNRPSGPINQVVQQQQILIQNQPISQQQQQQQPQIQYQQQQPNLPPQQQFQKVSCLTLSLFHNQNCVYMFLSYRSQCSNNRILSSSNNNNHSNRCNKFNYNSHLSKHRNNSLSR